MRINTRLSPRTRACTTSISRSGAEEPGNEARRGHGLVSRSQTLTRKAGESLVTLAY